MLNKEQIEAYHRDGFILVEDAVRPDLLARIHALLASFVEKARNVAQSNEVYDFEDTHSPENPRIRRLKDPVNRDPLFWEVIRDPGVIGPVTQLIGPNVRLFGSKLNMKSAGYGAAVEWHQDWAFYPHTNDDVLAVGIMLDDVTAENGPLMVVPGSHTGPTLDHHSGGYFIGGIERAASKFDLSAAIPLLGRAGSMTIHHARTIHGSALNLSGQPRRLLFYEIAAADAWPLWSDVTAIKYRNFDHFNQQMIVGEPTIEPRMVALPVRMPGPWHDGKVEGIFGLQSKGQERYFGSYQEKAEPAKVAEPAK